MLRWRLILGPVFLAALVAWCWLDWRAAWPGIYLLPLAVLLSLVAAGELLAMFRRRPAESQPRPWTVYGGVLVTVLLAGMPVVLPTTSPDTGNVAALGWLAIGLSAGLFVAVIGEMRRYESPGHATTRLALSAFAVLYLGGLIGFMAGLRLIGDNDRGMLALLSLLATVKMSDIGQYVAGRLFGRHRLAPRISPGKTWEGVLGGLLFAAVAAWTVLDWGSRYLVDATSGEAVPAAGIISVIAFAVALVAAGIVGDLAESLLKRDVGLKDSSTWLPGFGGVLDMLDSLLAAAPVAYLFWALGWVGPPIR